MVKYKTDFERFTPGKIGFKSSPRRRDRSGRTGIFSYLNPGFENRGGVASINRARAVNTSDFGLLIDAGYRTGPLHLLCEVVGINSRRQNGTETELGFYAEAAYELTKKSLLYGGFYGAESLTDDLLVVGYKTGITPHVAIQGEICNTWITGTRHWD